MNGASSGCRLSAAAQTRLTRRAALHLGGVALGALTGQRLIAVTAQGESAPNATGDATLPPFSAEDQLALEGIVQEQVAAQRAPGAVAGVWAAGKGGWTYAVGSAICGPRLRSSATIMFGSAA